MWLAIPIILLPLTLLIIFFLPFFCLYCRLDDSLGPSESIHSPKPSMSNLEHNSNPSHVNGKFGNTDSAQPGLIQPIAIQFNIVLESLTVGAALLPSLTAKYQVKNIRHSSINQTYCKTCM